MRSRFPLHRSFLYDAHDGFLGRGIGDGVRPAVTDDEKGRIGAVVLIPSRQQVDVGDELHRPGGPNGGASDGDAQLECPALLDGEEYPEQQPEEEMEDRADDAGEDGAVQAAAIHHGVVVEQRCAADCDRQEHAERGAVYEVDPAVALAAVLRQDHATFALLVQEGREPTHTDTCIARRAIRHT